LTPSSAASTTCPFKGKSYWLQSLVEWSDNHTVGGTLAAQGIDHRAACHLVRRGSVARRRFAAEAARLPLRPADRAPGRRRALAWVRVLDGLRCLFPEEFQARYTHELARHAGQEPQP
jgi:hypothetical protein